MTRDQIATIIRTHQHTAHGCMCGWKLWGGSWSDHVAEQIAAAMPADGAPLRAHLPGCDEVERERDELAAELARVTGKEAA